ncbi:MAG: T9SS type A sorting domain-containing protein [Saprospiraceae bacterium]|nr:T9SS type A sorting domain-containing protein [Saprospiraceae bacterium]
MKHLYFLILLHILGPPATIGASECALDSLTMTVNHCDGETFYVYVDFDFNDGVGEAFKIVGNGENYGLFDYDKLPIKLGPLPADKEIHYEFGLSDAQDSTCQLMYELGVVHCQDTCAVTYLNVELSECNDEGVFDAYINFDAEGFDHFDVYYNFEAIGFYHIEELPIKIKGISASGKDAESFKICANDRTNCCQIIEVPSVNCHDACLQDLILTLVSCDGTVAEIMVNLGYDGEHSESFLLKGDGVEYGQFAYADLPIAVEVATHDHNYYEFLAIDIMHPDCVAHGMIGASCELECTLKESRVNVISCSDGLMDVEIDFVPAEDNAMRFSVQSNGFLHGHYGYEDLPIALLGLAADGSTDYEFIISDSASQSCLGVLELAAISCQCAIDSFIIASGDCHTDSSYVVELDFKTSAFITFDLYVNDAYFDNYQVANLPIRWEDFPSSGKEEDKIKIYGQGSEECYLKTYLVTPSCKRNSCGLNDLAMEVTDCKDGEAFAWINFHHDADQSAYFTVHGNGKEYGKFAYESLPVKVGPLQGDEAGAFELVIKDREFRYCSLVVEGQLDCAPDECAFYDIETVINACEDSLLFTFTLDFSMGNTPHSEAFIIDVCEETFIFNYSDLPVEVGPFAGGETFYHFSIRDTSITCEAQAVIGRVICEEQCDFEDVETEIIECLQDSLYVLRIHKIASSFTAFDVYVNEDYYGFFPLESLPIDLTIFGDGSADLLTICVSDNTTCCIAREIDPELCQPDLPCEIVSFRADSIICSGNSFYPILSIAHMGPSEAFILRGNGKNYGTFLYENNPIKIGPLPIGDKEYEFEVRDANNEECVSSIELVQVVCESSLLLPDQHLLVLESGGRKALFRIPDMVAELSLLEIFDVQGRLINQRRFSSDSDYIVMEIPPLMGGMYVLRLQNISGMMEVRRFIMY